MSNVSTGLSIFQELALDADEDERETDSLLASSLLQREAVQTPVQLSNALMKALKVGGDDKAEPVSTQTKNQDKKRENCECCFRVYLWCGEFCISVRMVPSLSSFPCLTHEAASTPVIPAHL